MSLFKHHVLIGAALIALGTTACGQAGPTGPTAGGAGSPSPASTQASISGTVNGGGSGLMAQTTHAGNTNGVTVTIVGTAISATISNGAFTLVGVPPGDVRLQFSGPGVNATISITGISSGEQIRINVTLTSSSANVDSQQRLTADAKAELEGLISEINKTARTLRVMGSTVSAPDGTVIRHGQTPVAFDDLENGYRVHVRGTVQTDTVIAQEIILQNPAPSAPAPPPAGAGDNPRMEFTGTVQSFSGVAGCPAVQFSVAGTPVVTNAATNFKHGPCAHLENGTQVEAETVRQADGSRLATKVEMVEVEITGTISAKGAAACPALTMTVGGRTVQTFSWTSFERAACSALVDGDRVEVKGSLHPGNLIKAIRVRFEGR